MSLKKIGSLYQKTDKNGSTYLVGKLREPVPDGKYLYVFKNTKGKEYDTSADFYACIQEKDEEKE